MTVWFMLLGFSVFRTVSDVPVLTFRMSASSWRYLPLSRAGKLNTRNRLLCISRLAQSVVVRFMGGRSVVACLSIRMTQFMLCMLTSIRLVVWRRTTLVICLTT